MMSNAGRTISRGQRNSVFSQDSIGGQKQKAKDRKKSFCEGSFHTGHLR